MILLFHNLFLVMERFQSDHFSRLYSDAVLSERKRYFNYRTRWGRMVTEGASGKLKGRWRILSRKCENQKESEKKRGWHV